MERFDGGKTVWTFFGRSFKSADTVARVDRQSTSVRRRAHEVRENILDDGKQFVDEIGLLLKDLVEVASVFPRESGADRLSVRSNATRSPS